MSSSHTTQDREQDGLHGDSGLHPTRARRTEEPPPFWRAPFSAHYYREVGYVLTGLPVAIAGFVVAIPLFALGLGTIVTALGLPVLAGLTVAARGLGRLERSRVRTMLALDVPAPAPVRQVRPGTWGAITARMADAAGWKAVLYQVLNFPWAVLSFVLTLVFQVLGWALLLYPLYHWVFATYTPWPGARLFDYRDSKGVEHVYYIQGVWQIAGLAVAGLLIILLTAQLVRALTNVNRAAARGLLGR
ncbi:sensor domain-containing protein [Kitasatospora aureofaciens]|uniref:sensor domain-containing protein n=1 Tax=Kitasatospora aureofaciens TaxID=1894 RepID=UPI001C4624DB|nr:sensor domain-containing protein [Kitasatospora aureofaciens]MBV6701425.1 sensor domain-containing protein [Kitasatospora aureofaciens]